MKKKDRINKGKVMRRKRKKREHGAGKLGEKRERM